MGILRSFNIGVSGLHASGQGLSVVGDNIANAGTFGFKASRAEFQDVLATSLKGGDQFGAGTKLAHIKPLMTQGDITKTDSITDLAISGNGFFVVDAPFGRGFTRDGSLHFDKEGFLVTGDGYRVLGFSSNSSGEIGHAVEAIQLGNTTIPAKATENVKVNMNLDSRDPILQFDINDPENTSNFSSSMTVFDNVGTPRMVTLHFNKTANNAWTYRAVVDGADAANGTPGRAVQMAEGRVLFNEQGQLQSVQEVNNAFNFADGAAPNQKIKFSFGKTIAEGGNGLDAATQYGATSNVSRHTQDGSSAATLASMSFNDDGILTAVYNNGESRSIAQIAVGKFENNEGLFKTGKNLFKESRRSGQAALGKPGEGGRGEVLAKSLELSNVDLASEFVNLMTGQRNFQANAKTITTSDQMLQEVLNIKR